MHHPHFLKTLHLGAGPVDPLPCDVQHAQAGSTLRSPDHASLLQAHSAAQQVLPDGTLGEPLEGAIEIAASCGLPDGLPSIAQLLSDAVKGALPGIPRPLQVSHCVYGICS